MPQPTPPPWLITNRIRGSSSNSSYVGSASEDDFAELSHPTSAKADPASLQCIASAGASSNSTRTTSRPELAQCGQSSRRFIRESMALRHLRHLSQMAVCRKYKTTRRRWSLCDVSRGSVNHSSATSHEADTGQSEAKQCERGWLGNRSDRIDTAII